MEPKTLFIASDHAGFSVKSSVFEKASTLGWKVEDLGPSNDERVDYPDFADQVCTKVINTPESFGVLICGSGQGMAMRANKYPKIRAALCWTPESAELSRQHNNANILCLGGRLIEKDSLLKILETFLTVEFEGGRHQARVEKISKELK